MLFALFEEGLAGRDLPERRHRKRHSKLTPWRHRKLTPEETAYVDGSAGSEGLSADGGFRAGRWCWSCRTGVPSRDGTAWLSRTVWSTTTQWKGRSVERQPECRGRLVWRTRRRWDGRCRWLRQACLEAALSRARTTSGWALTLGRARILRSAKPGQTGALVCGRTSRWLIEILRMNVVPVSVIDDDRCGDTSTAPLWIRHTVPQQQFASRSRRRAVYLSAPFPPSVSSSTTHRYVTP